MGVINDKGFPFTNVDGDRLYSSETWREYFNALVESGIVGDIGNEFVVTEISVPAKKIKIDTGAVLLKGAMRTITTAIELDVEENVSGNTRIDRVIARFDSENREIDFHILKGTPDAEPVAPSLTRTTDIWEVSFAQIELENGYSVILNENITDERDTEGVCEYFRYRAKPAWYPPTLSTATVDAWMYMNFQNLLTEQEISDIEANETLMEIINNAIPTSPVNDVFVSTIPSDNPVSEIDTNVYTGLVQQGNGIQYKKTFKFNGRGRFRIKFKYKQTTGSGIIQITDASNAVLSSKALGAMTEYTDNYIDLLDNVEYGKTFKIGIAGGYYEGTLNIKDIQFCLSKETYNYFDNFEIVV